MEVTNAEGGRHPPPSSTQAADLLRERVAEGVRTIPIDPQDFQFWMSDKCLELRDAIEFGDQESILSLTDLIHRGAAQNQTFPSMVTNVVSA